MVAQRKLSKPGQAAGTREPCSAAPLRDRAVVPVMAVNSSTEALSWCDRGFGLPGFLPRIHPPWFPGFCGFVLVHLSPGFMCVLSNLTQFPLFVCLLPTAKPGVLKTSKMVHILFQICHEMTVWRQMSNFHKDCERLRKSLGWMAATSTARIAFLGYPCTSS